MNYRADLISALFYWGEYYESQGACRQGKGSAVLRQGALEQAERGRVPFTFRGGGLYNRSGRYIYLYDLFGYNDLFRNLFYRLDYGNFKLGFYRNRNNRNDNQLHSYRVQSCRRFDLRKPRQTHAKDETVCAHCVPVGNYHRNMLLFYSVRKL